jgi:hypothetical protein
MLGGRESKCNCSWRQEDSDDEPAYLEGPQVELLAKRGSGVIYLAVEGTASRARASLIRSPVRSARPEL